MRASTVTLAIFSLLRLSSAAPSPVELAPRCGTTVYPYLLQQLTEAAPNVVNPDTSGIGGAFQVAQTVNPNNGRVRNRVYQIVAFRGIPAGAYACQLNVKFPSPYPIANSGTPTLNVTTLYKGSPGSIIDYPNGYTWNKFFPPTTPPFGQGLFGTITLVQGQNAAINSQGCERRMAFVFEIASWISISSSVQFNNNNFAGVYLTHTC